MRSLYIMLRDLISGEKAAPALSQVTHLKTHELDRDTWQSIEKDILASGADAESVKSQQKFIKSWIDTVMIGEDGIDDSLSIVPPAVTAGRPDKRKVIGARYQG